MSLRLLHSPRAKKLFTLALLAFLAGDAAAQNGGDKPGPCTTDAMIVFDASGSMAGNMDSGIATTKPRIDEVRRALARVVPNITSHRRVGLITYGPGPYQQCNVKLDFAPMPSAGEAILRDVNALNPAGKTPLTAAVRQAVEVLDYRRRPGVVLLVTDGEETCGGAPCDLGKELHAGAADLTVHVISFRVKNIYWTGEQSVVDTKCLAEANGGLFITAENEDDLVEAFQKTLGCPMLSQRNMP
jgi:Ca-activated chloride channel family protein